MADNKDDENDYMLDDDQDTDVTDIPKIKEPNQYIVVLHNDDYTPMEFVVEILISIFHKSEKAATDIMLNVHEKGKGVCGIYSYEIAETKVIKIHEMARQFEYPLKATLESE